MEVHLSNDRIIAYHRNRKDYVDAPENTLRFAYGDNRYEKMTKDLVCETDILKLKTLEEINEDFRRSDFINLALMSSDLLSVLVDHLRDKTDSIRELASRAIVQVCSLKFGRDKIMEKAYIHHIAELIDDPQASIRTNAYLAMNNLAEFRDGAEHILAAEKLPSFVDKLIEEKVDSILISILQLIKKILEGQDATIAILQTQAISRLTTLLENKAWRIRELAASNLASISFLEEGKIKEIELKCVLPLCKRLDDSKNAVRESATLCLASLAQRNEAKQQILDFSYFASIMELLDDQSKQTQLNTIQLIASVAEHPLGRKKANICLEKLHTLADNPENAFIVPYIKGTIDVIQWVP